MYIQYYMRLVNNIMPQDQEEREGRVSMLVRRDGWGFWGGRGGEEVRGVRK